MRSTCIMVCGVLCLTVLAFGVTACSPDEPLVIATVSGLSQDVVTEAPAKEATESPSKATAELPQEDHAELVSWEDREIYRAGLIEEAQGVLDELPGASIYHIEFSISDDKLRLEGHEAVKYTNRESEALEEVYFQLFPNAAGGKSEISNVTVDGAGIEPVYEPGLTAARIPLQEPLTPGAATIIELDFVVDVAQEMAGNYGLFGYFNDILVLDEFYPVIPVYDQDGWHYHVPSNGDMTYLDASFYLVRVSAPKKLVTVASGIEVEREAHGKQQVVTYAVGPARDFYLAASDKFKLVSTEVGETTINSYAFPNRKDGAQYALDVGEDALHIFNRRFGAYPYVEMDIVSTPMQALGVEYPGIMGITLEAYDLNGTVVNLPAPVILESTVVHEVGHQYFYNAVGNNQVDEPWLDEALAQYVTALYFKDRGGTSGYNSFRDSWYFRWARVENEEIPIGMPSKAYEPKEYSAIIYGRAPLFIEALAVEIGEQAFDAFLREYYQSFMWEISTGEAFKQLAEQHCDCDLTALFDEWVNE